MQAWEYCVITGMDGGSGGVKTSYPRLVFFSQKGIEREVLLGNKAAKARPAGWTDASEEAYTAYWIAKLGAEGWEMVGTGTITNGMSYASGHSLYFKRLL